MHIPPQLPIIRPSDSQITNPNSAPKTNQGTSVPIDATKLTLEALAKLPVKQLESALNTTSMTSPEALAKAMSVKQPTLLDAIVAKAQILTVEQQKLLPAKLQQAVSQWLNSRVPSSPSTSQSAQSKVALLSLIIPSQAPAENSKTAATNAKLAMPVQLNALAPLNAAPKPGTPVSIILRTDGGITVNQPMTQATANRNSSANTAALGQQPAQLSSSASAKPIKLPAMQASLKLGAFTPLTSSPNANSNSTQSTPQSMLSIAVNQLKLLAGSNPPAMQSVTKTTIEQLNATLTQAMQLPQAKLLQALPKPLLNTLEQALPKASITLNNLNAGLPTLEPLLNQITPKAQLQQLPAIAAALTILGKLLPSATLASTQTPSQDTSAEIEAIHQLMKQDLTQLSQNITRSLLARAPSQGNELLNLQHEFALQTENGWLNANLHIEEKPHKSNTSKKQTNEKAPQWEVNLSLEVPMSARSPLPMDVRVTWFNANTQINFWSTDIEACRQLELHKLELISTLQDSGINVKDCFIEQGSAPKKHRAITQQMTNIDIHT